MKPAPATKFPGFPAGGPEFLSKLKRNNNREWFHKNRGAYEIQLRTPMEQLVEALAVEFESFAPEIVASPKASLYRIHRDTRFSKDKTPYKTHVAAVFPARELDKHGGAGFYFHFDPAELLIGGGLYMPGPEDLTAVRRHIMHNMKKFQEIINAAPFKRFYGALQGEQLVRVPRGFPADHPAAGYLRFKQFLAAATFPTDLVTRPQFYRTVVKAFRTLHPLVRFLNEPILRNRRLQKRREALQG